MMSINEQVERLNEDIIEYLSLIKINKFIEGQKQVQIEFEEDGEDYPSMNEEYLISHTDIFLEKFIEEYLVITEDEEGDEEDDITQYINLDLISEELKNYMITFVKRINFVLYNKFPDYPYDYEELYHLENFDLLFILKQYAEKYCSEFTNNDYVRKDNLILMFQKYFNRERLPIMK
jgi:hypothetical protein